MHVFERLKHWFVPTEHNRYHAHLLRWPSLVAVAMVVVVTQVACNSVFSGKPAVLAFASDINSSTIVSLTNQQRTQNNFSALNTNQQLTQAAQAKAQDMFEDNYWAHVSPSGKTPWDFIKGSGYTYQYAGENLAKDFNTSNGVVTGWMNSPEHKANILDAHYTDIGVGVMNGKIDGQETTLVVAMYATPQTGIVDSALQSLGMVASAQSTDAVSAPSPLSYNWSNLLPLGKGLNLTEIGIIFLLLGFALLYLNDHRIKVKFALPRHEHSHSLMQAAILVSAIAVILISSGLGKVG